MCELLTVVVVDFSYVLAGSWRILGSYAVGEG